MLFITMKSGHSRLDPLPPPLPPPFQSARSAPGVSAAPHSQPASPRLRHDRHRPPPAPLYSSGSYQECCCYECDYGRGRPPPLPPESPGTTITEGGGGGGGVRQRAAAYRKPIVTYIRLMTQKCPLWPDIDPRDLTLTQR